MKPRPHEVAALLVLIIAVGCSGVSTVERANLTKMESREHFIEMNPNSLYCANIHNGEIVRGMNIYEVIASWGLPNVYLASRKEPVESWVYYVQDADTRSILIYTLSFRENLLESWDIDMKRFVDQRVSYDGDRPQKLVPDDGAKRTAAKR